MRKLYVATLVVVMVLGIFVTASNAEETPNEDVALVEVETPIDDAEESDIDVESEEVSTEDEDVNIEDEEDFVEIYLDKDDVYVYTAVYDPDADAWFLYETCRHCELAGCTETTPEEIYDRFGVKVN